MSGNSKQIICARCKIAIEVRPDANAEPEAFCPACGISDKLENAQREASEFLFINTQKRVNAPFERLARTSQNFKFTSRVVPERTYRFIVDAK